MRTYKTNTKSSILSDPGSWPVLIQFLFYPKPYTHSQSLFFRIPLWFLVAFLTLTIFINGPDASIVLFLHSLNLAIHETGHIVFSIFGNDIIHSLGGSLFQCIMPMICCIALWIKPRDIFGASIALWWTFENVIDSVPYIADARLMLLNLTSGTTGAEAPYGFHDWNFILSETGHLRECYSIASNVQTIGLIGLTISVLWGAWSLIYNILYQRKKSSFI